MAYYQGKLSEMTCVKDTTDSSLEMASQEEIDRIADNVINYLETLKTAYKIQVEGNKEILAEFGYTVENDVPFEVHQHFVKMVHNDPDFGLDRESIPDYVQSMLDNIAADKQETELKKQLARVNVIVADLEKEEIHLKREVENCRKVAEVIEENAVDAEIKFIQLKSKINKYTSELANLQTHDIVSKYEDIKNLQTRRTELKRKIEEAESELKIYCGLPPNIKKAKDFIENAKDECKELKNEVDRLVLKNL